MLMSLPFFMSQVPTQKNAAGTAARPPQKKTEAKGDFRKKQGAVRGRRVHVGKIKCRDQHRAQGARCARRMHVGKIMYRDQRRAEQVRFAQHVQLCVRVSLFVSGSLWGG